MRYRLVHVSGSQAGHARDFYARQVVLGRDPAADVVFGPEDATVSRRHALIAHQDGVLVVRDLGSRTGTIVDGHDVEEAEVVHGDVIELGRGGPRLRIELQDFDVQHTIAVDAPPSLRSASARAAAPPAEPEPPPLPGSRLRVTFLSGTREGSILELGGGVIRVGRARGAGVWLPEDRTVSAQHAKIVRLPPGYAVVDLESRNGTYVNGRRVQRAALRSGDVIGLGAAGPELRVQVLAPERADSVATVVIPNFAELAGRRQHGMLLREMDVAGPVSVGRDTDSGLRLESPMVSRYHARVFVADGRLHVQDLDSANGTFVDGRRVETAALSPGQAAVVGPFQLVAALRGDVPVLRVLDTRSRARLDAHGLTVRAGARTLLEDVTLPLGPGTLTAVIGPSGSGKSTLVRALGGACPPAAGVVRLNGVDLYRSFAAVHASLGHVPQDDIVHAELTPSESLHYTARLRLPPDTTAAERERRINDVLGTLELAERRDTPIHRLSGGQRKRASIAAELLTEPSVLLLDEPTSGLDPGLEEALMLLLRELSYKGKTVVVVTHTLDHLHLCDAVALLDRGRLTFYGAPDEVRAHFGLDQMVNLYARLKERPAAEWEAEYRSTEAFRTHVEAALPAPALADATAPPALPRAAGPGPWRQLRVTAARYARTLLRDRRNAILLLAQAPLIAGLIGLSLLYGAGDVAYTKPRNTLLFLLALTAVWFGCANAARELVKERAIYLRERMGGLRVAPYVLGKVLVLFVLALVQCVVFLAILHAWFGIPGDLRLLISGMALAALAGILLGLAVSAWSSTSDRAMTLLPILLIPQVLFTAPAVQMDMKGPAGLVARAMPTWWSFDLLRRVALAPDGALDDEALEARVRTGTPVLMTRARVESMLQQGYPLTRYRERIETTWTASLPDRLGAFLPGRFGRWRAAAADVLVLVGFAAALFAAALALQARYDAWRRRG